MLDLARQLRRDMTLPERMLWNAIRGRRLGPRFRREVPMDPYIVDFYCPDAKLIRRGGRRAAWLSCCALHRG
ncbi:MAG TPA: DUF559 domain-containing protein [Candidatus Dormibacteraeota bacterium]|jgi:very-short-patch-repair endonuclease